MLKKFALVIVVVLIFCVLMYTIFLSTLNTTYIDFIQQELGKYNTNLDIASILSIIKIESDFDSKVVSKKGAVGLMQIMPSTAEFIINNKDFISKNGELDMQNIDLTDYKTNIKLGVWYLNYLEQKFTKIEYVICSYNAGEGVVSGWIKDNIPLNNIPYKETKNYLKRFKLYYPHYKNKVNIIFSFSYI